jgi:hypothetical protein
VATVLPTRPTQILQELDSIADLARQVYDACAVQTPPNASGMLAALAERRRAYEAMAKIAQALGLLRQDAGLTTLEVEQLYNKLAAVLTKFPEARAAVEAAFDE